MTSNKKYFGCVFRSGLFISLSLFWTGVNAHSSGIRILWKIALSGQEKCNVGREREMHIRLIFTWSWISSTTFFLTMKVDACILHVLRERKNGVLNIKKVFFLRPLHFLWCSYCIHTIFKYIFMTVGEIFWNEMRETRIWSFGGFVYQTEVCLDSCGMENRMKQLGFFMKGDIEMNVNVISLWLLHCRCSFDV